MIPKKSFCIWFTPRTGSTLLCKSLEATGVAGKPGEFLNIPEGENLFNHYEVENFESLKARLCAEGCSDNGVMGIKYSFYTFQNNNIGSQLADMQDMDMTGIKDWKIFSGIFPNCNHFYLTRRNKIRQAVSWWKAIQNQLWHLEQGQTEEIPPHFYDDKYDFDALMHLLKETNLREAAIEEFFDLNGISPYPVVYEDFIRDYEGTILSILDKLELDHSEVMIGSMPLKKTANSGSELWVQRFRNELQKNWERAMW